MLLKIQGGVVIMAFGAQNPQFRPVAPASGYRQPQGTAGGIQQGTLRGSTVSKGVGKTIRGLVDKVSNAVKKLFNQVLGRGSASRPKGPQSVVTITRFPAPAYPGAGGACLVAQQNRAFFQGAPQGPLPGRPQQAAPLYVVSGRSPMASGSHGDNVTVSSVPETMLRSTPSPVPPPRFHTPAEGGVGVGGIAGDPRQETIDSSLAGPIRTVGGAQQGVQTLDVGRWFQNMALETETSQKARTGVSSTTKRPSEESLPEAEFFHTEQRVDHRFSNVLCPRETAVSIEGEEKVLHANHVEMPDGSRYIATQAPTEGTSELFWKTCLSEDSRVVVDLTNSNDRGVSPYYPIPSPEHVGADGKVSEDAPGETIGDLSIKCTSQKGEGKIVTSKYTITNTKTGETGEVTRVHYRGWKDFGGAAAGELQGLIDHIDRVSEQVGGGPMMVHCRAGVGRTGSFITARTLSNLHKSGELTSENFEQTTQDAILSGREQRGPLFVQSQAQLQGLIKFGNELLKS
ncbi:MAG: protein-tyrosine phosphatase family protein [Waddliaceae bacterium]